jgi:hypothetical protein
MGFTFVVDMPGIRVRLETRAGRKPLTTRNRGAKVPRDVNANSASYASLFNASSFPHFELERPYILPNEIYNL